MPQRAITTIAQGALTLKPKRHLDLVNPQGITYMLRPLQQLHFTYCPYYGCSQGMRQFLRDSLSTLADRYPSVQFVVRCRPRHAPGLFAQYMTGYSRYVPVPKAGVQDIEKQLSYLLDAAGSKPVRFTEKVLSTMPAVRPIWSPFHDNMKCNPLNEFK